MCCHSGPGKTSLAQNGAPGRHCSPVGPPIFRLALSGSQTWALENHRNSQDGQGAGPAPHTSQPGGDQGLPLRQAGVGVGCGWLGIHSTGFSRFSSCRTDGSVRWSQPGALGPSVTMFRVPQVPRGGHGGPRMAGPKGAAPHQPLRRDPRPRPDKQPRVWGPLRTPWVGGHTQASEVWVWRHLPCLS